MPFSTADFAQVRPYLYHLTATWNLPRIRRTRRLESAAVLARQAGRPDLIEARRRDHVELSVHGEQVSLRDQAPLHAGNMRLDPMWSFAQFVRHLNERVFFWPGTLAGPISYGMRHFGRYEIEQPSILRVRFTSLLEENPDLEPRFCRYNSGSPRWNRGVASPRGESTFVPAAEASFRPAQVVEVTAVGSVILPEDTQWGAVPAGPWQRLF